MTSAVITCAITGPIATTDDNPHLPVTPEAIAESARGAHEAGAAVVHLHLRDEQGRPTADLEIAKRTVALVADSCDALVQLSTGVGLTVPFEQRERLVEARPRMASLNPCSMSFAGGEFRNPPDGVRGSRHACASSGSSPSSRSTTRGTSTSRWRWRRRVSSRSRSRSRS